MLIESRSALDPELAALVTAQQQEVRESAAFSPDDDSAYLVAAVDGRAVACTYIRGRGIARQLIVWVEEEALAAGCPTIRLDVILLLEAAIGLLLGGGYRPIPAYGEYAGNPDRVCFEKRLVALVQ